MSTAKRLKKRRSEAVIIETHRPTENINTNVNNTMIAIDIHLWFHVLPHHWGGRKWEVLGYECSIQWGPQPSPMRNKAGWGPGDRGSQTPGCSVIAGNHGGIGELEVAMWACDDGW